jgi:hypothetical protein
MMVVVEIGVRMGYQVKKVARSSFSEANVTLKMWSCVMMKEQSQGPGGGAIYHITRPRQLLPEMPDAIIIRQSLLETLAGAFRCPDSGR